jgi:hypothetical protein
MELSRGKPNPSNRWVSWDVRRDRAGEVGLMVVGVDGRALRSWRAKTLWGGVTTILWDGEDSRGVRAPSGRYYMVVTDEDGATRSSPATIVR